MRNGIYDRINYSQVPSFFVYFGWQRSTLPPLYGISSVSNTPGTSGSTIGGASPLPNERDCPDLFCLLSYFARQNTWAAMTRFAASAPFNVFLYEGIETIFTVLIVIIVQCVSFITGLRNVTKRMLTKNLLHYLGCISLASYALS